VASALEFQGDKPRDCDRKVELPEHRLQISQTSGERINRHDVAVAGRRQGREAEIHHRVEFRRYTIGKRQVVKGGWPQLPDQAEDRGEDQREIEIHNDRALKAARRDTARGINCMHYHSSQCRKDNDVSAAPDHARRYRRPQRPEEEARTSRCQTEQNKKNGAPSVRRCDDDQNDKKNQSVGGSLRYRQSARRQRLREKNGA